MQLFVCVSGYRTWQTNRFCTFEFHQSESKEVFLRGKRKDPAIAESDVPMPSRIAPGDIFGRTG